MNGDVTAIFSLYRSCLRQIRRLPTEYLRQFFRLKVGDDVRVILDPRRQHLHPTKIRRVRKDLRKLEGANAGHAKCFNYVLDLAYGRRGPLRWEILDPLRSEPGAPLPPRIIPAVESSRPPVYSKEMRALLTSDASRTTRALTPAALLNPPILPARADPNSPEAHALGPFSKRREVNIRRRFFQQELQKIMLPLQVVVDDHLGSGDPPSARTDKSSLAQVGIRSVGLQDSGVFEELEALAAVPNKTRHSAKDGAPNDRGPVQGSSPRFSSHLPERFLRRRYQQLLVRTPILVYKPSRTASNKEQVAKGKFQVTLSPHAAKRGTPVHRVASEADLAWIQHAEELQGRTSKQNRK
ncbi:hypothetical protein C8Q73DRAFT_389456 [Cubamyces lactineus]|nr:hypothetical protein C8Q73DRAFT_389456 [Cubamyces lactineus]